MPALMLMKPPEAVENASVKPSGTLPSKGLAQVMITVAVDGQQSTVTIRVDWRPLLASD
jgi:hypothetical protein